MAWALKWSSGGPSIEFELEFPRARVYRTWVQFQRKGVVNTVAISVPVGEASPKA